MEKSYWASDRASVLELCNTSSFEVCLAEEPTPNPYESMACQMKCSASSFPWTLNGQLFLPCSYPFSFFSNGKIKPHFISPIVSEVLKVVLLRGFRSRRANCQSLKIHDLPKKCGILFFFVRAIRHVRFAMLLTHFRKNIPSPFS